MKRNSNGSKSRINTRPVIRATPLPDSRRKWMPLLGASLALALYAPDASAASILWDPVNAGNGHYYELVLTPNLTWSQANSLANNASFNGMSGHLVTITSAAEQSFLRRNFILSNPTRLWLGGFQDLMARDYSEPGGGWRWVTGEQFSYTNWNIGANPGSTQPNNWNGAPENFLVTQNASLTWNDLPDNYAAHFPAFAPTGYLVEYEPIPEPTTAILGAIGLLAITRKRRTD